MDWRYSGIVLSLVGLVGSSIATQCSVSGLRGRRSSYRRRICRRKTDVSGNSDTGRLSKGAITGRSVLRDTSHSSGDGSVPGMLAEQTAPRLALCCLTASGS